MPIDVATDSYLEECRRGVDAAPSDPDWEVVLGFDGYCDRVRTVIAERESATVYDTMDSMADIAARLQESVDLRNSCSLEWEITERRAGGHAANVGRAYRSLGVSPTLVGTFGEETKTVFEREFSDERLLSVGSPSVTDAIEFADGKLMFTDIRTMSTLDWETVKERLGLAQIVRAVDGSALLSTGYWATIPELPSIWGGLREDVWPRLDDPPAEVLVDPSDLRRMAESRVKGGVQELARLDDVVPVIFSANRAETLYLAEAVLEDSGDGLPGVASALREALDVTYVISHAEHLSVLATPERVYTCAPPRVDDPELTTGVGDCFNAGYLYARLLGLSRGGSLTLANLAANWFLRRGTPPEPAPLSAFVDAERSAWV